MRLILIGPPGVGKGTQSALLSARLGLPTYSSGEIFRKEIEAQTDLGRLANRYISHGELVPNGVTIEMMAKRLREPESRTKGFVLDGFPRTVKQAEALREILTEVDAPLHKAISLEAPDDLIVSGFRAESAAPNAAPSIMPSTNLPSVKGFAMSATVTCLCGRTTSPKPSVNGSAASISTPSRWSNITRGMNLLQRIDGSQEAEVVYSLITNPGTSQES